MTANDTTYFLSNPHQWNEPTERHRNSFHFLTLTQPYRHKTYTKEEITHALERIATPELQEGGTPDIPCCFIGKDRLAEPVISL